MPDRGSVSLAACANWSTMEPDAARAFLVAFEALMRRAQPEADVGV